MIRQLEVKTFLPVASRFNLFENSSMHNNCLTEYSIEFLLSKKYLLKVDFRLKIYIITSNTAMSATVRALRSFKREHQDEVTLQKFKHQFEICDLTLSKSSSRSHQYFFGTTLEQTSLFERFTKSLNHMESWIAEF